MILKSQFNPCIKELAAHASHQTEITVFLSQTIDNTSPGEVFRITPAVFAYTIDDMQENIERYLNRQVEIEGFVFRHEHFPDELFFAARMQITCCISDALFTGVLIRSEDALQFAHDSWVRVAGTVSAEPYTDVWTGRSYEAPVILAESIEQIEKPEVVFIYPK